MTDISASPCVCVCMAMPLAVCGPYQTINTAQYTHHTRERISCAVIENKIINTVSIVCTMG